MGAGAQVCAEGPARVASVGRGWVCLTQRLFQTDPIDPLQGTAEPLSQDCGDSVITYLRKGKNAAQQL